MTSLCESSTHSACLNTRKSRVKKWERGQKHPKNPSLKLLDLVKKSDVLAYFAGFSPE